MSESVEVGLWKKKSTTPQLRASDFQDRGPSGEPTRVLLKQVIAHLKSKENGVGQVTGCPWPFTVSLWFVTSISWTLRPAVQRWRCGELPATSLLQFLRRKVTPGCWDLADVVFFAAGERNGLLGLTQQCLRLNRISIFSSYDVVSDFCPCTTALLMSSERAPGESESRHFYWSSVSEDV